MTIVFFSIIHFFSPKITHTFLQVILSVCQCLLLLLTAKTQPEIKSTCACVCQRVLIGNQILNESETDACVTTMSV